MSTSQTITPKGILDAVVIPPGSKSITNRALILAALARGGHTTLTGVLDSDDTRVMFDGLAKLGLPLHWDTERSQIYVHENGGGLFPNHQADIFVGNSGTTARFLTAILAFTHGNYRIHGKPRMHQRPIRDLVEALNTLGGNITYEADEGFPPLLIHPYVPSPFEEREKQSPLSQRVSGGIGEKAYSPHPSPLPEGEGTFAKRTVAKTVSVSGAVSSQFLSALLLAAPCAVRESAVEIRVSGELVSKPYVEMTLRMMQSFGVFVKTDEHFRSFRIREPFYQSPGEYAIEPDASAASYFWAAAAVCGGSVTVQGLSRYSSRGSLQGDVAFVECLEKMNCEVTWNEHSITVCRPPERPLRGITVNMNSISDTAQTLSVVALFAEGATEIRNIEHVRFKETDRIADLATELRRFGAAVEEYQDGLRITPPRALSPAMVKTYDDHRMAMSFAVAGLKLPGVVIGDPDCTQKTFPEFFETLKGLATVSAT